MSQEEDSGELGSYVVVENPSGNILAKRLSRNKITTEPPKPNTMTREQSDPTRVPPLLQFDYRQAELCGPNSTGLRARIRRSVPKHLKTLGVTNVRWLHWMGELAKVQQAEPYPSIGTGPIWVMQASDCRLTTHPRVFMRCNHVCSAAA